MLAVVGDEKITSREDHIGLLFLNVQSDENTLPKGDRGCDNQRTLLRNPVSSQGLHVGLRFDKRFSNEMIYKITYGCPFERVTSDFLNLNKVVNSY